MTRPADSTTLQLTCSVDRHTIIWVHCAPASVCSIRTCKYVGSAQNSKCRLALGEAKQQMGLKETLDTGFLFRRVALSLSLHADQNPCSGRPLPQPFPIPCGFIAPVPQNPSETRGSFPFLSHSSWKVVGSRLGPGGSFCLDDHFSSPPPESF